MRTESVIFVVRGDGEVSRIAQRDYVKLLGGALQLPQHANKALRIADWYVDRREGGARIVVNETYSVLKLDARGAIDWSRCRVGRGRNPALYEALRSSKYEDPDEDPAVQQLRAQTCDEVAWLPNPAERELMQRLLESI